jgi:hypothetical protein
VTSPEDNALERMRLLLEESHRLMEAAKALAKYSSGMRERARNSREAARAKRQEVQKSAEEFRKPDTKSGHNKSSENPRDSTPAKGNGSMKGPVPAMHFQNDLGNSIEINSQNFEAVLHGAQYGLTPVKFKSGTVEWIRASEEEILDAVGR